MGFSNRYLIRFTACVVVVIFSCCGHDNSKNENYEPPLDALFRLLPASVTGINFENTVVNSKEFNIFSYRNFFNGGGVAVGDINNDGLPDIYFTANQAPNKLYLNKGGLKFEDITQESKTGGSKFWSTGVTMADVNADGWLDIYVCNSGRINGGNRENELFINQQNGTFSEEAKKYGLDEPDGLTTHAAFFDYDGDGDLDCYILNNSYRPIESFGYNRNLRHIRDAKGGDKLYENQDGHFVDVSVKAGIYGSEIGFGLGITIGDVNGDSWPDIYISNDFFERDYLYLNNRNGTFTEALEDAMGSISLSSMGADMADINNDGLLDIFSTDMLPESDYRLKTITKFDNFDVFNAKLKNDFHHQFSRNMLQLNNGDGTFSEIGQLAGVFQTDWSWGALFFDFDNDGWNDLFVANGISKDLTDQDFTEYFANAIGRKQEELPEMNELLNKIPSTRIPNYAFVNQRNLQFENKAAQLGLAHPSFSNGAAYGDFDNDGDLDLIVSNVNSPCFVYQNTSDKKQHFNFIKLQFRGTGNNTFGVGSKIVLYTNGEKQVREQMPSRGFESSVEPLVHFGLAGHGVIDSMLVTWPDRRMQLLKNIKANQTITLKQKDAYPAVKNLQTFVQPLFVEDSSVINGNALHTENLYIDFDKELLLPSLLSLEGPKCAWGDINGDGMEDIILGGAKGDQLRLLIQEKGGTFKVRTSPEIQLTKEYYEDTGIGLFDTDKDGDLDLMIASGGNEPVNAGMPGLQTRLYINDGSGNFSNGIVKMPAVNTNASCLRPFDYDDDGDLDVFIGGRSTPGNYGKIPKSYLLENDGTGNFKDVSSTIGKELQHCGMITDALWTDLDGDKRTELVVCGEWMPITAYAYENGTFVKRKLKGLDELYGWWNVIKVADVNNDGKPDIIGGNLGLNAKLKAHIQRPVQLFAGDFDANGTQETIMTLYKSDSISYPLHLRGDLIGQMPSFKKKFLLHKEYAGKPVGEVLSEKQVKDAASFAANYFSTSIFINRGELGFEKRELPVHAQFSPVYAIQAADFNNDGKTDLFLSGNFGGLKPELGRYDASYGQIFMGDGKGHFSFLPSDRSGISVKGEARDVLYYQTSGGHSYLLIALNNERPKIYRLNR